MSNIVFELHAETRAHEGKAASRRLRRCDDKVPGVVYGGAKEPVSIMLQHKDLMQSLSHEAFVSHILTLHIDGKKEKVVLKAVQRHPFKPKVTHFDLLRIREDQAITMNVPLHFMNEETAPGVKQGGGVITHHMNTVEVSCLPSDLPEFIEVDMGQLELDQSIHCSNMTLPKGVSIVALMHEEDPLVVSIHAPKAQKEETEESAAEASASQGDSKPESDSK